MHWVAHALVRVLGWKFEGAPPEESKYVAVFAPHTSVWDAILGLAIRFGIEERPASWIVKDSVYRWPFRRILTWLGAIPIDRGRGHNVVEQVAGIYKRRDTMVLGITPEGTRKRVPRWKTGFYHIACKADVPILMCYMDYERKVAGIGPLLHPTGDIAADMAKFAEFYAQVTPKHPEREGPVWDSPSPESVEKESICVDSGDDELSGGCTG